MIELTEGRMQGWGDRVLINNSWPLCCMVQTGNHMTMSILRRIFVKDMEQCPLNRPPKLGCGNHMEQETSSVCLVRWHQS